MGINTQLSLFRLGVMLQENQYLSMDVITERLSIAPRTVHRYIEKLRKEYGAPPIHYEGMSMIFSRTKPWDFFGELRKKLYQ